MSFAALLTGLAGPLVKRGAAALGLGMVSFIGVSAVVDQLLDHVRTAWAGGLAGNAAALLAMGGVNTAVSIIAGAILARVALMSFKRLGAVSGIT